MYYDIIRHENVWQWGKTITLVGDDGKAIVKMSFENDDPGVCFISDLSVVPDVRRQGLATQLMRVCERICSDMGIFRLDLDSVLVDWVQDFYKKLGYVRIREENGLLHMYKLLKKEEAKDYGLPTLLTRD